MHGLLQVAAPVSPRCGQYIAFDFQFDVLLRHVGLPKTRIGCVFTTMGAHGYFAPEVPLCMGSVLHPKRPWGPHSLSHSGMCPSKMEVSAIDITAVAQLSPR